MVVNSLEKINLGPFRYTSNLKPSWPTVPLLTPSSLDPFGNEVPPSTNWSNCDYTNSAGDLVEFECLDYHDENLTQAHIDLAANRMILASPNVFMRWTTNDHAFLPVEGDPATGPVNGDLGEEDGTFKNAVWMRAAGQLQHLGLIQLDRDHGRGWIHLRYD